MIKIGTYLGIQLGVYSKYLLNYDLGKCADCLNYPPKDIKIEKTSKYIFDIVYSFLFCILT